jgi:hypothetical protein
LFKQKLLENFELLGNRVTEYGVNPKAILVVNGPFREDFRLVEDDPTLKNRLLKKYGDVIVIESNLVFPQPGALYEDLVSTHPIEKIYVFEEGYGRVIYLQLLELVNRRDLEVKVLDCAIPYEPRIYERFSYIDHILNG